MKKKFTENEIIGAMKKADMDPSKDWQKKVSYELRIMAAKEDFKPAETQSPNWVKWFSLLSTNLFFNYKNMKKLVSIAIVAVLVVVGGLYYYSPAQQATRHLNKAQVALDQLRLYTQDQAFAMVNTSVIPCAYAEDEEDLVEELVETVVEETEAAIEKCEEIKKTKKTRKLLGEIDKMQDKSIDVLSDVLEKVKNEKAIAAIEKAIDETVAENEEVEEELDKTEEAEESGEDEVEVEIATSEDPEGQERARERIQEKNEEKLQEAKQLMEGLNENTELTESMQQKRETVQALIDECEGGEKCQAGKVKGLAIALKAKVKNEVRAQEREESKTGLSERDEDQPGYGSPNEEPGTGQRSEGVNEEGQYLYNQQEGENPGGTEAIEKPVSDMETPEYQNKVQIQPGSEQ